MLKYTNVSDYGSMDDSATVSLVPCHIQTNNPQLNNCSAIEMPSTNSKTVSDLELTPEKKQILLAIEVLNTKSLDLLTFIRVGLYKTICEEKDCKEAIEFVRSALVQLKNLSEEYSNLRSRIIYLCDKDESNFFLKRYFNAKSTILSETYSSSLLRGEWLHGVYDIVSFDCKQNRDQLIKEIAKLDYQISVYPMRHRFKYTRKEDVPDCCSCCIS